MTPTPEQLDYARRWMIARGKEPLSLVRSAVGNYCWHGSPYDSKHYFEIPLILCRAMRATYFPTRDAAIEALALALAECRAACEIPEDAK